VGSVIVYKCGSTGSKLKTLLGAGLMDLASVGLSWDLQLDDLLRRKRSGHGSEQCRKKELNNMGDIE
jgi:hypothetical protein